LGDRYYRALDPGSTGQKISAHTTEGEQMRAVMKVFDEKKKKFSNNVRDMKLDLPKPLDNLNIPGKVLGGELTITKYVAFILFGLSVGLTGFSEEMKSFFDWCVDGVVELIQGQIQQVEIKKNRVKVNNSLPKNVTVRLLILQNVFLIGGFGESPYLQEELKESLDLRRITMRRPDTSQVYPIHLSVEGF
jgi:hypothetical protein